MKSLYESILSSTKSGKAITATKIEEWWRKYFEDKGNFTVEMIDGKFFVIVDDFAGQPRQGTVQIGPGPFRDMPKDLAGIYYYSYENRDNKKLTVPKITFSFIKGEKIDLGHWDLSKNEKPNSIIDLHIQFYGCKDIRVVGLPKYKDVFNTYFSSGSDNRLHRIKAPNCNLGLYDDTTKISSIENCEFRELIVAWRNFGKFSYRPYLVSTRCSYIIEKEWEEEIERLLENNKIGTLRYNPEADDKKLLNKNLKIVPNQNKNWERYKYKMVDL